MSQSSNSMWVATLEEQPLLSWISKSGRSTEMFDDLDKLHPCQLFELDRVPSFKRSVSSGSQVVCWADPSKTLWWTAIDEVCFPSSLPPSLFRKLDIPTKYMEESNHTSYPSPFSKWCLHTDWFCFFAHSNKLHVDCQSSFFLSSLLSLNSWLHSVKLMHLSFLFFPFSFYFSLSLFYTCTHAWKAECMELTF